MGLAASGKSSIRSVVFEGKLPGDVEQQQATINYIRSPENIVDSPFTLFDCGGQNSFISDFVGKKAGFIFSKVAALIWIIDASDTATILSSQLYFINAIKQLNEYSPGAAVYVFFHKMDLFQNKKAREEVIRLLEPFFKSEFGLQVTYRATSIFDGTASGAIGEILQEQLLKSTKARTVTQALRDFISRNQELSGIAIYTGNGLPVFEEGFDTDKLLLPVNLWLTNHSRISSQFDAAPYKLVLETGDLVLVFQQLNREFFLSGICKKLTPLQHVLLKLDQLTGIISSLL